jgi:hypothetical protein
MIILGLETTCELTLTFKAHHSQNEILIKNVKSIPKDCSDTFLQVGKLETICELNLSNFQSTSQSK